MTTRYSVLVVDDEEDFREVMVKKLRKRGLECDIAHDGETALDKFRPGKFDVVLLDVKMPGMDGIEVLQEMKKIAPLTEVLMLTGHASVESGINGIKYGAFDYLMKPLDIDRLMKKLDAAYKQKRTQEEKIEKALIKKHMVMPS